MIEFCLVTISHNFIAFDIFFCRSSKRLTINIDFSFLFKFILADEKGEAFGMDMIFFAISGLWCSLAYLIQSSLY